MLIDKMFDIRRIRRVQQNFLMNLNLMFLYVSPVLPPKFINKPFIQNTRYYTTLCLFRKGLIQP